MNWGIRRIVNGCARQLLVARRDVIAPEFISYRFIAIGAIARGMVLVAYTEQENGALRIISARWATRRETEMICPRGSSPP
ncbi:MAG: BrnT family toxin [Acidobacteriota bacterium]